MEEGIIDSARETDICILSSRLNRAGRHRLSRKRDSLSQDQEDTADVTV